MTLTTTPPPAALDDLDLVAVLELLEHPPFVIRLGVDVPGRPFPTGPEHEIEGEVIGVCGRCGRLAWVTAGGNQYHRRAEPTADGSTIAAWDDPKVCP